MFLRRMTRFASLSLATSRDTLDPNPMEPIQRSVIVLGDRASITARLPSQFAEEREPFH